MDTTRRTTLVLGPGEGTRIGAMGIEHLFKVTAGESDGLLSVEEFALAPHSPGARPHVHHSHDEYFYVVDGALTFHDGTGEVVAPAGTLVAAVRGSVHGFRNASDTPAKALCLYTPGGFEGFFRELHAAIEAGEEPGDVLMAQMRAGYDSETVG